MKNHTTPRTQAECQFTTGYETKRITRIDWREVVRGLITCAVFVGLGVLLAWRG